MQIIITTRGRIYEQCTLQSLPPELRKRTRLVCPKREVDSLHRLYPDVKIAWEPYRKMKLPQKREWIIKTWHDAGYTKILMLDDDLNFATRKNKRLPKSTDEELIAAFQRIEAKLGPEFPHVGLGQRQFNNRIKEVGWKIPGKMQCALGYYLPVVAKEVRWDLVLLRSDYCASLQLLLKGYANAVWTETVVEQARGFDAPGGCKTYRTPEMLNDEAEKFARLFPNYVSVGKRKYGRLEVTVQWQNALRDGQRNRSRFFVC
jgi:hypothetical protein